MIIGAVGGAVLAVAALVGISFQLLNPVLQVMVRRGNASESAFDGLAGPLQWTPPGLLASAPGRPSRRRWDRC